MGTTQLWAENWRKLTKEIYGEDPVAAQAARDRSSKLVEELNLAATAVVQAELPRIVELFEDRRPLFRQKGVAMIASLAYLRSDGEQILKPIAPLLLSLFEDKDPMIRENAILSIALARPRPPAAAVDALRSALNLSGGDVRRAREFAAGALVRLSDVEPEAKRSVVEFLRSPRPAKELVLALDGVVAAGGAQFHASVGVELLEAVGDLVESSDDKVGLTATRVLRDQIQAKNRDARFRQLAGPVLERAGRNEGLSAARREAAREAMKLLLRAP